MCPTCPCAADDGGGTVHLEECRRLATVDVMSRLDAFRTAAPREVLVALAAVLVLGVIAMHNLATGPSLGFATAHTASSHGTVAPGHGDVAAEAPHAGSPSSNGHGDHGSSPMDECGGLLAACLSLLVGLAGLVLLRRGPSRRLLWLRVRATLVDLGRSRPPVLTSTPLHRVTVLRC